MNPSLNFQLLIFPGERERERERERGGRQTDRQTDRQRKRKRERETKRERERETDRQTDRQTESQRERQRETQRERERERERQTDRQRTPAEGVSLPMWRGNVLRPYTQTSHPTECSRQSVIQLSATPLDNLKISLISLT